MIPCAVLLCHYRGSLPYLSDFAAPETQRVLRAFAERRSDHDAPWAASHRDGFSPLVLESALCFLASSRWGWPEGCLLRDLLGRVTLANARRNQRSYPAQNHFADLQEYGSGSLCNSLYDINYTDLQCYPAQYSCCLVIVFGHGCHGVTQ